MNNFGGYFHANVTPPAEGLTAPWDKQNGFRCKTTRDQTTPFLKTAEATMKFEIKTVAQVARILASLSNKRPYGTLATVDMQGIARARTVVLRHFDAEAFTVRLSTHHHAGKVVQLRKNPEAELTLWLDEQKVQLRLLTEWRVVDARRETSPDLRQAAWLEHSPGSRQTFYWPDPGQRLSPRARPPAQQDPLPETPPASFALLIGTVVEMDCLQIMQPVHVRYLHTRERSRWSTQRITP